MKASLFPSATGVCLMVMICGAGLWAADNPEPVLTVTHTGNSGPGSLRQAILDANARPGREIIHFRIDRGTPDPQTGAYTIPELRPDESPDEIPLPEVTDPLIIDGYSQPGAAPATAHRPARLLIEISRSGLQFSRTAAHSVLRGLVINDAPSHGVFMRITGMY